MKIDSHQHFWVYNPEEYPWMTDELATIRRDHLPPDLQKELELGGLDGSVAVQARQSVRETEWLLELADRHPLIKGVVGWVDLQSGDAASQLARFADYPLFAGVRHVVQDEPDDEFMLRPGFLRGIEALKSFGLTYDILVFPRQLPAAIGLVQRFPEQPFVLDHIGKPPVREGVLSPWREQIEELARFPNLMCKVSGMVTEADWRGWKPGDFRPYLDVVFGAFGEDRVMFGSDWPVCRLAAEYQQIYQLAADYCAQFSLQAKEKFFGANAVRFYQIKE